MLYDEGGAQGENLPWTQGIWGSRYLKSGLIWDETGSISKNNYSQPPTGIPYGRTFVIDQQGRVVLANFGYDADLIIRTIHELLNKPGIGECRGSVDGTEVRLAAKIVTAGSSEIGGAFYVEESDRSCGIRVEWGQAPAIPSGIAVDVVGKLATLPSGERIIKPESVTPGAAASIGPLALSNRDLAGWSCKSSGMTQPTGVNCMGLFVTTWGKVTEIAGDRFWIDDGSKVAADMGHMGICIITNGFNLPETVAKDAFIQVTGIISCYRNNCGTMTRCILARTAADIRAAE